MAIKEEQQIIDKARQGFEEDLFADDYAQIHEDDQHLHMLLNLCRFEPGKRYLDLGTGNGFFAFGISERYPEVNVVGMDIVEKAIETNNQRAKDQELNNL